MRAQLMVESAGGVQALPELLHARVMRITLNGIVITGMEYIARSTHSKSNVARHRQTWWCLVHTLSAAQSVGLGDTYEDEIFEGNGL